MQKICIFTSAHPPFDVRIFHRQARSLSQAGYCVVLLVAADKHKVSEHDHIEVKKIKRGKNRFWRFLSVFSLLHKCLQERAALYHFHDPELLPAGIVLKLLTRKPVIYDCHENFSQVAYERTWYPQWLKPLLSKSIAFFEPLMATCLDAVICVVPDQCPGFEHKNCRTVLIRNYPRLEIFRHQRYKSTVKKNQIIYLGNISAARGIFVLLKMMLRLKQTHPHIKLVCLGMFSEQTVRTKTLKYIEENQLKQQVEFIPPVPHHQVPHYLFSSRIGLAPFQKQKHTMKMFAPNKIFEYMACTLPVIASQLPSLEKLISDAKAGLLFYPTNAGELHQKVTVLLDDEALQSKLGQSGRRYVFQHVSWEQEEIKLLNLYRTLV